jgi:hypothetical protein
MATAVDAAAEPGASPSEAGIRHSLAQRRLVHGARFRVLPLNVKCRARCAFCYESTVSKLLPHVRTHYIPPYDEARFDEFRQMHARACQWEQETGRAPVYSILPTLARTPDGIAHFPVCDVFSSGLSHAQIEEFVQMRAGDTCLLYAVGLDIDPDFIGYLTRKYPDVFRLHLSIVTFDRSKRARLMHPDIDVEVLRKVCTLTRHATFFLMLFDAEQIASDIEQILTSSCAANGGLFVHKLYYDRCSPQRVVDYAEGAHREREAAIRRIAALALDGRPLSFSLGADIQAYTRRREIYGLLQACTGAQDEAIFCSPGAFAVIRDHFGPDSSAVVAMDCVFGGNLDLVQGTTARGVIGQLERLLGAGRHLRRVLLPDAMFWIDQECDVNGDTVELIRERFPELEVVLLAVPGLVMWSVVELRDCLAFFDAPGRSCFEAAR